MGISGEWAEAIEGFCRVLRAGGSRETTIKARRQHLENLARGLGGSPWAVQYEELEAWLGERTWSQETRRSRRTTFDRFWSWGVASKRATVNPARELPKVKASIPAARPAPDRVYMKALMRSKPRERLMLRLGAEIGLRRAEISRVHSDDLMEDLTGWSLLVHGKGGRTRIVPLPDELAYELHLLPEGFAFPGRIDGHLSPRRVGEVTAELMDGKWTLHTLRHRFASRAYAVDRDVFVVQDLLGHASPATTRRYVQVPRDALRATVNAARAAV